MLLSVVRGFCRIQSVFCRYLLVGILSLAFTNAIAGTRPPSKVTVYGAQVAAMPLALSRVALQIGRPDDINELVRRLLETMGDLSHYDVDVPMPVVRVTPLADIHQRFCGRPCTIRAAYVPGEGLYYDAAMRPLTNRYDQSVLFHELVHHVQVENESHPDGRECHRWGAREVEAYALQNRFLNSLGVASRVIYPGRACAPA